MLRRVMIGWVNCAKSVNLAQIQIFRETKSPLTTRQVRKMSEQPAKDRGALIVIEGCDRSGKSTQCRLLDKNLGLLHDVKLMKYPDRTTKIGKMINEYLECKQDVDDHAVHLLFSANRWEQKSTILKLLRNGTTVIIDRYAYSGVCYTAAKQGFSLEWCKKSDLGLPLPDVVIYLTLTPEAASARGGFGDERYEDAEFQKRVNENYNQIKDDSWKIIDADMSVDDLQAQLQNICRQVIEESKQKPIYKLWTDGCY